MVIERSTVSKILKTLVITAEVNKDLTKIKRNRNAKYPQLESALYEWQLRYENIAIILVPFLEQQNCDMESALTNLKQLRDQICDMKQKNLKQTNIRDYFKPI